MSPEHWSTHAVELRSRSVIKRFRGEHRQQAEREWRALTLLARYAPGLAPEPWEADLEAHEPTVVMSRLSGEPLRGRSLDRAHIKALTKTLSRLYGAVPPDALAAVPRRPGHQQDLVAHLRSWGPQVRLQTSEEVRHAMNRGLAWLAGSGMETAGLPDVPRVFGPGDGNLANYLWDGSEVRVVDFEDSGASDRAFELAEITEHVASWVDQPLDVEALLGQFELTTGESVRLGECRRLLALVWLFLLSFDKGNKPRNPPGTAERQASRLLNLLD
ncbi:phosphotransferase family protein [Streptomyces sp. NPDC048248]|uniref:phosphotransferase family protein n=1 Tax=Streptomyces sp. NPDC048248 TaxID=3365523 RepID=UPI00371AEA8E